MRAHALRMAAILPALLLFALFAPAGAQQASASEYYYFKTPSSGASYTVGTKIPISFYAGVVIKQTKMDAWGNPSSVTYSDMPVTLKVLKGNTVLYSEEFTYTKGTTIETSYKANDTGTLKLQIYGKSLGLNVTEQTLQATLTIKVKKKKASAVKSIKPKIAVERTDKKIAEITCSNSSGFGMKVYRATKKNGKYKLVKTTSKSTYTDKKLSAKKVYYYKARLYAKSGNKTYVSKWSAKKIAAKFKSGKVTLSYSSSKGVKVTWAKISGAGYYLVGRNTVGTKGEYEVIECGDSKTTTFYDKDVVKGKTYYYSIVAENGDTEVVGKYMSDAYKITIP